MEFVDKVLPFKHLLFGSDSTLSDFVTALSVVIICLVFIGFLTWTFYVVLKLRSHLKQASQKISIEELESNKYLNLVWQDYAATFINLSGLKKTDEFSYDFFNERNLLSSNTNLRLLNSVPSMLVGLGILGTFIGLTLGVSSFKTGSTDEIKDSITILLGGLGTAFVTSIWGMLLSLLFTIVEKVLINSLHGSIHQFCYKLDRRYKLTKEDERLIEIGKQREIISEYFLFKDEQNNLVKPANVFRDIYEESRKQTQALSAFSTDLALKIEVGFEKILNEQIQFSVVPLLEALKEEIQKLGKNLEDPTTEMTQAVIQDLKTAMSSMVEEFKTSVSGSTKSEMEKLATMLGSAGSSLESFPDKLETMTINLNKNFEGLQNVVQQISQDTYSQSQQSMVRMRQEVEDMANALKDKVGDLQVGQEALLEKQSENAQASAQLLTFFNSTVDRLNGASTEMEKTITEFTKLQNNIGLSVAQLKAVSEQANSSTSSLRASQETFQKYSEAYINNNQRTLEEIQKSLSQAKELASDYAQKFEIIEKGLQGIFSQIEAGMIGYRDSVGESLELYLGKYTDSLTKTAQALAEASSKQEDILDELTEQLSKFNGSGFLVK